jgi:hypothetical protein
MARFLAKTRFVHLNKTPYLSNKNHSTQICVEPTQLEFLYFVKECSKFAPILIFWMKTTNQ